MSGRDIVFLLAGAALSWTALGAWFSRQPRVHDEEWSVLRDAVEWERSKTQHHNNWWRAESRLRASIARYRKWRGE